MLASPVINRELRAEARNSFNYMLRVLGGGVVIAVFALLMADQRGNAASLGARLFHELNLALFAAVMLCVPMLTADCISREKREGTLGLLFLTPLTARDIVIGKSLIHTIRAFTLLLAVLPVGLLPFVLGGVSGWSFLHAVTLNLSGLLLALAAGLLASVRQVEWIRAVVFAEILSAGFAIALQVFPAFASLFASLVQQRLGGPAAWLLLNINLVIALFVFWRAVRHAGVKLDKIWQEETAAPPQPAWVKIFSTSDFWQSVFRWNKSRTLDRNPIAWLQEYSWTARLTKWGWCGFIVAYEVLVLLNYRHLSYHDWQIRLAFLLTLGLAFSAAWSFRRERQTGALELLLVTPLTPIQISTGRLWGLWCHFFPSYAVMLFVWLFNPFQLSRYETGMILFFFVSFLIVPVIGLYFSLRRWPFLVAWLLTVAVGLLLPYFIGMSLVPQVRRSSGLRMAPYVTMCLVQGGAGLCAWWQLQNNLKRRTFAVERTGT
jgi:ABC-type transport system involved in multi-copper enzyme maturation permease subunit